MSYEEFRRRIDTARNILVGAVPSPAGQIDQITYALIYKFMNDIDDKAASLPDGKRSFFTGDYEKYNWHALMSSSLGAHERLELYRQAIQNMSKNENLPPLFREIYNNAFLPFNSANVLNLFLKEMNKFDHSDSDDIGDAYEYLLSITGSQGDVGQFRTPRHIIKFIVEAVNPTKDDSVLDPACGTAGFLIAAYNHVKSQHDGLDEDGIKNDEKRLTSDEFAKIYQNYHGFDIDPTMVRTSEVNLYLHGFTTPDIRNHDTLSSEDFWDKKYDVILANPPFMTPKGGIQPHKKFSINANRAEVLFVDYIASHINPVSGRAGIVVPEGIIFQSGNAYKQLRKNLVEDSLYAVISLPAGVFQPYSGVKTSVLLLDKKLAKERDEILFIKVENDGYSLGAQRRIVGGDQFPEAHQIIEKFKTGQDINSKLAHKVSRKKIAESGDYNLSGDRYRINVKTDFELFPNVEIGSIIIENSKSNIKVGDAKQSNGEVIFFTSGSEQLKYDSSLIKGENIFIATGGNANIFYYNGPAAYSTDTWSIKSKDAVLTKYLYYILKNKTNLINEKMFKGAGLKHLDKHLFRSFQIPLPPLEIQEQIVAELDGYAGIIAGAKQITQNWKPKIDIGPEWEKVKLGDAFKIDSGGTPSSTEKKYWDGDIKWATLVDIPQTIETVIDTKRKITSEGLKNSSAKLFPKGTVMVSSRATIGRIAIAGTEMTTNQGFKNVVVDSKNEPVYVAYALSEKVEEMESLASGGTFKEISKTYFSNLEIPLPPLAVQRQIVEKIEAERALVESSKKLIEIYEQKTKDKLAGIWGEE